MGNVCQNSMATDNVNFDENASDIEWETRLPPHYHKILSRAVTQKKCSSKEEIYVALCNSILIEEGKQIVWLDQSTEKIGLKASARSLVIIWGNEDKYWRWVQTEESSFGQVAELVEVWWFEVYQRFECTLLSSNTEYTVAFIVKIDKSRTNSYPSPFVFSFKTPEGNWTRSARFLDDLDKPVESHEGLQMTPLRYAENGWIEFIVGEFFLKEDDGCGRTRVIDVYMKNENSSFSKSGIFLDGVKITPKQL
ncbi:hypothetical protein SUGI_0722640 [Cryptomeria japonica]|uniref:F-box protein At2g02240-like isoform X2 n=1 Tax=Cryptomeria japonica TaxID=3369 RepID=UPI002414B629|nr:F-box protein At2g02240-like isoform X2 [Cryptomeria japonica]GLJ36021.1 hypothetical protein SUGI_0722640 [Cryptomeria japonica]